MKIEDLIRVLNTCVPQGADVKLRLFDEKYTLRILSGYDDTVQCTFVDASFDGLLLQVKEWTIDKLKEMAEAAAELGSHFGRL